MNNASASLAHSITWASSKQSYLTARLLADRDLADDCLRAYAYFRWADDLIDITLPCSQARFAFIRRQNELVERLYAGETPPDLCPEEAMLADLIAHDRTPDSGLRSFIRNFMAVIAFDACRQGRAVTRRELFGYTTCLATAVMDGIQYFIGCGQPYPRTNKRIFAVTGAHITHMLRDTLEDLSAGLVNIPAEDIEKYGLDGKDVDSLAFRQWVHDQVEVARDCFREGQTYIDSLDVLRCKLAGVWYCARFETVLTAIERDGYRLRADYPERHGAMAWLNMARLGVLVICQHYTRRLRMFFFRTYRQAEMQSRLNIPSYHIK
jgi:phytoene/squalene synthetase